jgi:hypothetical protein
MAKIVVDPNSLPDRAIPIPGAKPPVLSLPYQDFSHSEEVDDFPQAAPRDPPDGWDFFWRLKLFEQLCGKRAHSYDVFPRKTLRLRKSWLCQAQRFLMHDESGETQSAPQQHPVS